MKNNDHLNKKQRTGESEYHENLVSLEDADSSSNEPLEQLKVYQETIEHDGSVGDEEEKYQGNDAGTEGNIFQQRYNDSLDQFVEISDEHEYIGVAEGTIDFQSGDESSVGSQSVSTVAGDSVFNSRAFLLIDPVKRDGKLTIHFTELRPNTILGSKQGNHFISHRLVLEFCAKKMSGVNLTGIPNALDQAFKAVIPDIQYRSDTISYPTIPDEYPEYDKAVMDALKGIDNGFVGLEYYKKGVRQARAEKVTQFISNLLGAYNCMDDITSCVSSANSEKSGVNISAAIIALRGVSKVIALGSDIDDDKKIQLTQEFIGINELFTDGVRKLFPEITGGVQAIREHFGFPKDFCKTSSVDSKVYENFFQALSNKCHDERVIASLINTFFDFPTSKGIRPQTLYTLSSRCFYFVLGAFPVLEALDKAKLIESFSQEITKDGLIFDKGVFQNSITKWHATTITVGY